MSRVHRSITAVVATLALAVSLLWPVSPATAAWKYIYYDQFTRVDGQTWQDAPLGGPYTLRKTSGAGFDVVNGRGKVAVKPGKTLVLLPSQKQKGREMRVLFDVKQGTAPGGTAYYGMGVRSQNDGSEYRVQVRVTPTGKTVLAVHRVNGKKLTTLKVVTVEGLDVRTAWHTVEFSITGTDTVTIQGRIWRKVLGIGRKTLHLEVTDSTSSRISSSGAVNLRVHAAASSTSTTRANVDNIRALAGGQPIVRAPAASTTQP